MIKNVKVKILSNFNPLYMSEEEKIKRIKKAGNNSVKYALKWLPKKYKILEDITLESRVEPQKFDKIIIGENGIFHIVTKNYGGENECKIKIDKDNRFIVKLADNKEIVKYAIKDLEKHSYVLKENLDWQFGDNTYKPVNIIVLTNVNSEIEGLENSSNIVLKADNIDDFILNYKSDRKLNKEEIKYLYDKLNLIKRK